MSVFLFIALLLAVGAAYCLTRSIVRADRSPDGKKDTQQEWIIVVTQVIGLTPSIEGRISTSWFERGIKPKTKKAGLCFIPWPICEWRRTRTVRIGPERIGLPHPVFGHKLASNEVVSTVFSDDEEEENRGNAEVNRFLQLIQNPPEYIAAGGQAGFNLIILREGIYPDINPDICPVVTANQEGALLVYGEIPGLSINPARLALFTTKQPTVASSDNPDTEDVEVAGTIGVFVARQGPTPLPAVQICRLGGGDDGWDDIRTAHQNGASDEELVDLALNPLLKSSNSFQSVTRYLRNGGRAGRVAGTTTAGQTLVVHPVYWDAERVSITHIRPGWSLVIIPTDGPIINEGNEDQEGESPDCVPPGFFAKVGGKVSPWRQAVTRRQLYLNPQQYDGRLVPNMPIVLGFEAGSENGQLTLKEEEVSYGIEPFDCRSNRGPKVKVSPRVIIEIPLENGPRIIAKYGSWQTLLKILSSVISSHFRDLLNTMPIRDIAENRGRIIKKIIKKLERAMTEYSVNLLEMTIGDIELPPEYQLAMDATATFGRQTEAEEAREGKERASLGANKVAGQAAGALAGEELRAVAEVIGSNNAAKREFTKNGQAAYPLVDGGGPSDRHAISAGIAMAVAAQEVSDDPNQPKVKKNPEAEQGHEEPSGGSDS